MLQLIVAVGAFTLGPLVCAVLAIGTGLRGAGHFPGPRRAGLWLD